MEVVHDVDQEGRGGAPANKGGYWTDPSGTGRTAWQYLTSVWSNCLGYFSQLRGFDRSAFGDLLSTGMTWVDARGAAGTRSVDSYSHNGDTRTLADLFKNGHGNVAVTLSGTQTVTVGPDYFTDQTQTQQIAIAIHEALHMSFPTLSDRDLAATLMQFGLKPSVDPSNARFNSQEITDWIVGSANHMDTTSGGCTNPGGH